MRCNDCDRLFEGPQQLENHLGSQKHKRKLEQLKRRANLDNGINILVKQRKRKQKKTEVD